MSRGRRAPRGLALINALVVVAAMAAMATTLLVRADQARQRLGWQQTTDQARLYLDAAARLVLIELDADAEQGEVDHPGEAWAQPRAGVEIDRGLVGWRIADLQGRFNVNWLLDPDPFWAEDSRLALERLARDQGLSPALVRQLSTALDPDSPRRATGYRAGPQGSLPRPELLVSVAELRLVDGMTDAEFDRIAPFLATLPSDSALNVNTVSPVVLAAFLEGVSVEAVERLLEAEREPFEEVDAFHSRILDRLGGIDIEGFEEDRLSVGSDWFEARLDAQLDTVVLRRNVVVRRQGSDVPSEIVLSLPELER